MISIIEKHIQNRRILLLISFFVGYLVSLRFLPSLNIVICTSLSQIMVLCNDEIYTAMDKRLIEAWKSPAFASKPATRSLSVCKLNSSHVASRERLFLFFLLGDIHGIRFPFIILSTSYCCPVFCH